MYQGGIQYFHCLLKQGVEMSEGFSYAHRELSGKAARHICTHTRSNAEARMPQTWWQSIFKGKDQSLSSARYIAAFTRC